MLHATFQVRAFAGWPGTRAKVSVVDPKSGQQNIIELKIITSRVYGNNEIHSGPVDDIFFAKGSLIFPCGGGTALEVSCYFDCDSEHYKYLKIVDEV